MDAGGRATQDAKTETSGATRNPVRPERSEVVPDETPKVVLR